MECVS
jgi:hypothetical protein